MISIKYSLILNLLNPTFALITVGSILLFVASRIIVESDENIDENKPPIGGPGEPGNGNGWN